MVDFYADGYFRVFDDTSNGSSFILEGTKIPSIQSLGWVSNAPDFKDLRDVTIGDLFCGAGIGSYGAKQAGIKAIYAFDNNKHAVDTYNLNIEPVAYVADAKKLNIEELPYVDIISAGFPCQPFSVNGKGLGEDDPDKGNLGKVTLDIILAKKPKAFFLENVKGLVSKKNKPFFLSLIEKFKEDYNVTWEVVNCADYGVPQNRERVFVVGLRKDLCENFIFPFKTHEYNHLSVRDAIGDIKDKGTYLRNHKEDCGIRNDEKPYIKYINDGQCWKHLPCEEMKKDFMKGAYFSSGGKTTYLAVIDKDKPARTILSSPKGKNSSQILKWEGQEHRRYTVRESLRLQSVPDDFYFADSVPLMKQYERCSGVPPRISYLFLKEIKAIIKRHTVA